MTRRVFMGSMALLAGDAAVSRGVPIPVGFFVPTAGYDVDAQAYFNAITGNGGTISASTKAAANTFIIAAKNNGYWSKIIRGNLFCGDQLAAALVPYKIGGGNATDINDNFVGVGTDYAETGSTGGMKGNGSTKYLDTGWNPVTYGLSTSSAGLWVYVKGTESSGTSRTFIGNESSGGTDAFICGLRLAGTVQCGAVAAASSPEYSPRLNAATEGLLGVSTDGSRSQQFYKNGSASGSPVTATGNLTSVSLYVLCSNAAGTPTFYENAAYNRGYAITTGFSSTDAANFSNDFNAFQTALSRNVY